MSANKILAVFKKEFKNYFQTPIGYIFLLIFLTTLNFLFFKSFFIVGQASMRLFFYLLVFVYLPFIPALTMRIFAEEKKTGTLEPLLTLPLTESEVVFGKFFACFAFLLLSLFLTISIPISVAKVGKPDWGPIICSYLGAILLGGAYISIGMFISSITENQVVSFIVSIICCVVLFLIGEDFFLFAIPDVLVPILKFISTNTHFLSIQRGVIDTQDIVYYFSVIFLFNFFTIKFLEKRKWG